MACLLDIRNGFGSSGTHSYFPDFSSVGTFVPCLLFSFTNPATCTTSHLLQTFPSPVTQSNLLRLMYDRNFQTYLNEHFDYRPSRDALAGKELPLKFLNILLGTVGVSNFVDTKGCCRSLTRCRFGMRRTANGKQCCLLCVKDETTGEVEAHLSSFARALRRTSFSFAVGKKWNMKGS